MRAMHLSSKEGAVGIVKQRDLGFCGSKRDCNVEIEFVATYAARY